MPSRLGKGRSMKPENVRRFAAMLLDANPSWRFGQAVFNAAYMLNEDAAEKLRGSICDPFYNDDKAEAFIEKFVEEVNASMG